tara:strand:+ start:68 stop:301 length:234 start_codon:yes stop_codon:yes gene_type:complete
MNFFIIAMILVAGNGTQYKFDIDEETVHTSLDSCVSMISDPAFKFKNKSFAFLKLTCIPEHKVEEYKVFMNKSNSSS